MAARLSGRFTELAASHCYDGSRAQYRFGSPWGQSVPSRLLSLEAYRCRFNRSGLRIPRRALLNHALLSDRLDGIVTAGFADFFQPCPNALNPGAHCPAATLVSILRAAMSRPFGPSPVGRGRAFATASPYLLVRACPHFFPTKRFEPCAFFCGVAHINREPFCRAAAIALAVGKQ